MARHLIIDHYVAEVTRLVSQLSMSLRRIGVSEPLAERVRVYETTLGEEHSRWKRITEVEIYRHFLDFVAARLRFSRDSSAHAHAYESAAEFENDLLLVRESLCANRGERLVELLIDPLVRKVRTFGFHLHRLDIRQHSRALTQACRTWLRRSSQDRAKARDLPPPSADTARDVSCDRGTQEESAPEAIRNFIVSDTQSEEDVLERGAAGGGMWCVVSRRVGDDPGLKPVPLFESIAALPRRLR